MKQEYTLTVYTENHIGLLNRIPTAGQLRVEVFGLDDADYDGREAVGDVICGPRFGTRPIC